MSDRVDDPEDIDTDAPDHHYDAVRYGSLKVLPSLVTDQKRKKGWRYRVFESSPIGGGARNWKTA